MPDGVATAADRRASLARIAAEAILTIATTVERSLDRHAAEYGITDAKLEVLEILSCCSGRRACLFTLGDRMGVTRPNVTKLIDGLERQGLVKRQPHPDDRRMVHAQLTEAGAEIAARALPDRVELLERLWQHLDEDELRDISEALVVAARTGPTNCAMKPSDAEALST
ncbi:MAG: MarR family transcriptional regulator [Actinobacteria bacterium]|nr:MarR family transcriptional regulator [Actinomycetota bacterium]MCB9010492.1 MarR family transcriptional regulator [Actinomycetota bacterium]